MTDLFHKGASMTKRICGTARIKGALDIIPRKPYRITKVGMFMDGDSPIAGILLEVADTETSRRRGLMGRKSLPPICGMLFEGLSGGGTFWMKDCLVPLDVAFMDGDGTVTGIFTMEADGGKRRYGYGEDVSSAVEAGKGFFRKKGISPGCRLVTRDIGKGDGDV